MEMRIFNRQFIAYGELLCFLAVWAIGLVVIFVNRDHSDQIADGELAANSAAHHTNFDPAR